MVTAAVGFSWDKTALLCKAEFLPSSCECAGFFPGVNAAIYATALSDGWGVDI